MYEKFFGLEAAPFGADPEPKFYFRTASHEEAFSCLEKEDTQELFDTVLQGIKDLEQK